jgi:hypothetical protein
MKKLLTLIAVFFTSLLNKEKKPHGGSENAKRGIIKKLLYNLYYVYDNYIIRALATKNVKKGLTDTDCRKSNNNVGTTLSGVRKSAFEKSEYGHSVEITDLVEIDRWKSNLANYDALNGHSINGVG